MKTLEKCVRILTLFGELNPSLSVADIASRLSLPKSTAYRYISALKVHGLIEEDTKEGDYRLGAKILELARSISGRPLQQIALPLMERLSDKTGETVILSSLRKQEGVCLEKVEGHHALRVSHERGATFPLHAGASGKVLLAYLDPKEQDEIIKRVGLTKFSKTTITNPHLLKDELASIKEQGFAKSDGEVIQGTYGIGAPIFSPSRNAIAALSISAPSYRLEGKKRKRTIQLVVTAAKEITNVLEARGVQ